MLSSDVEKHLRAAISAIRNGSDSDLALYVDYFSRSPSKLSELRTGVISHWKGDKVIQGVTHSECLRVLLAIPELWLSSARTCIQCVQADLINNTAALACISDVRVAIVGQSQRSASENHHVATGIRELALECLSPLTDSEKTNTSSSAFIMCLELIPTILSSLHALEEECMVGELLVDAFNVRWEQQHLVPMTNLMSELYPFLSVEHLEALKAELVNSAKELPYHSDDFAGIIRVALRLFEQSNDAQWVHVLRILYRAVPNRSILDVERMLEEVFQEFALASQHLIDALEDCVVAIGRAVVTRTYRKRTLLSLATDSVTLYDGVPVVSHHDLRLALAVTRAVDCAGRRAGSWQGSGGSLNHMNEIPLPSVLDLRDGMSAPIHASDFGDAPEATYDERVTARCLYILLLTCAALEIAELQRFGEFRPENTRTIVMDQVRYSIQQLRKDCDSGDNESGAADTASASASTGPEPELTRGWLCDARAQELIQMVLQLATHPDLGSAAEAVVNSWMATNNDTIMQFRTEEVRELVFAQVFGMMANMQPAIVTCVLKGLIACSAQDERRATDAYGAGAVPGEVASSSSSSGRTAPTAVAVEPLPSSGPIVTVMTIQPRFLPLHCALVRLLQNICTNTLGVRVIDAINLYFPTVVSLPVAGTVQAFLLALVPLCAQSQALFGRLHGYLQKRVQSTDEAKQLTAVLVLVPLLFAVSAPQQTEVARTVSFVFTRSAVVSREMYVLILGQLTKGPVSDEPGLGDAALVHLRDALKRQVGQHFRQLSSDGDESADRALVYDPSLRMKVLSARLDVEEDIEHSLLLLFRLEASLVARQEEGGQGLRRALLACLAAGLSEQPDPTAEDDGDEDMDGEEFVALKYLRGVLEFARQGFRCATDASNKGVEGEALLCRLGCAYAALCAVLACVLHIVDLRDAASMEAVQSVLTLIELAQAMATTLSNGEISTHTALRSCLLNKLSGRRAEPYSASAQSKVSDITSGGSAAELALALAAPLPLSALLQLVDYLAQCGNRYPTSISTGMVGTVASFVRTALTHPDNELSSHKTALLEKLMQLYRAHATISKEVHILTTEEGFYRQYMKQQRQQSQKIGHGSRQGLQWGKRRRKAHQRTRRNVRQALRRDAGDDDESGTDLAGAIDSDDCGSDSEESISAEEDSGGNIPRGFSLDFLRRGASSRASGSAPLSGAEEGEDNRRVNSRRGVPRLVIIGAEGTELSEDFETPDGAEASGRRLPRIYAEALLALPSHLHSAFKRWDVHIHGTATVQGDERLLESKRMSVAALHGEIRAVLFAARSELLLALAVCLPQIQGTSLAAKDLLEMGRFFATELSLSLERGVMIRTFNAFARLLDSIAFLLRSSPSSSAVERSTVGRTLWASLAVFRTPHAHIINITVQTALKFSDPVEASAACAAVLLSIGRRLFSRPPEPEGGDDEASSDDDSVHSSTHHTSLATSTAVATLENVSGEKSTATDDGSIVVSKEVSELVCREVLRQLAVSLTTLVRRPADVWPTLHQRAEGKESGGDRERDQGMAAFQQLSQYAGSLASALFGMFVDAPTGDADGPAVGRSPVQGRNRRQGSTKAPAPQTDNLNSPILLVDNLSPDRIGQLLEALTKLLVACNKECAALVKTAEHVRKVGAVAELSRQRDAERSECAVNRRALPSRARSAASFIGESSDDEEGCGFSDGEAAYDAQRIEEQVIKLGKATTDVTCTTLFGTLASVPSQQVLHLRLWLERRICEGPAQPRGDALALMKRIKATLTELDTHRGALGKLVEVIDRRPRQALLRPDDSECSDRLAKLIDQTYNPKVLSALELASTTGRELLEALLEAERAESDEEGAGQSSRAGKKKSVSISAIAAHKIATAGGVRSTGKAQVKRSRNRGVDLLMRLDGHTGDDSYADLENFLV